MYETLQLSASGAVGEGDGGVGGVVVDAAELTGVGEEEDESDGAAELTVVGEEEDESDGAADD